MVIKTLHNGLREGARGSSLHPIISNFSVIPCSEQEIPPAFSCRGSCWLDTEKIMKLLMYVSNTK